MGYSSKFKEIILQLAFFSTPYLLFFGTTCQPSRIFHGTLYMVHGTILLYLISQVLNMQRPVVSSCQTGFLKGFRISWMGM